MFTLFQSSGTEGRVINNEYKTQELCNSAKEKLEIEWKSDPVEWHRG